MRKLGRGDGVLGKVGICGDEILVRCVRWCLVWDELGGME